MTRGRQRKKVQQQAQALAEKEAVAAALRKGQGPATIASDKKRLLSDMDLVGQAIDGDWPVAENIKRIVVVALANAVIEGSEVTATDKERERFLKASNTLAKADSANIARKRANQVPAGGNQFNTFNTVVQVVETDDWYGTRAAANGHIAESNGASAGNHSLVGPIQGSGVRPSLGQNGHRTNGHVEGPRSASGPEAGGN